MIRPDRNETDQRAAKAARALENLSFLIRQAKDHISAEFVRTDGAAAAAQMSDGSRGSGIRDSVAQTVIARTQLLEKLMEINDDMDTVINIIGSCERTCRKVMGTRVPIEANRCDADRAKPGYDEPLSEGGWHDPSCANYARSATKHSLCNACRHRFDRWRARHDLKPGDEDRPVEFDSRPYIGPDGVGHAYPTEGAA